MLRTVASPPGPERVPEMASCLRRHRSRAVLRNGPDKSRQLSRDGDCGDLGQLAPTDEPPVFAVQAFLRLSRDPEDVSRTATTSLRELRAGGVATPVTPRGFDKDAAQMRVSHFRKWDRGARRRPYYLPNTPAP